MAAAVMTEPLFIFLYFLSVFLFLGYLKHKRYRWLILSGIITGLLPITRYIGLVCILTGIVTIVIFSETKKLMRFKSAMIFGLLGFLPLSIFGISVLLFANSSAHVGISGFNGSMMISRFKEIIIDTTQLIWKWVPFHTYIGELKLRYQILIILVILIMIVLITYLANQRSKNKKESPAIHLEYILFFIFGINGVGFVVFLIFTYVFHTLRMDDRQLLPVFLNCALSIICATALLINVWLNSTKFWKAIPVWGIVLSLLFSVYPQYSNSINILNMDQGLMASSWRYSETVRALRQIPPNIPIVSNSAAALLYWADRPAYEMFDSLTANFVGETTPYGSDDTDRAQKAFHDSKGILVIFTNFPKQMSSSFSERGYSRLSTIFSGLFLQGKYDDGTIYSLEPDTIH
jgi:4-amino-4-deoxy-L-arabinose transferase-like glycosyltransferase